MKLFNRIIAVLIAILIGTSFTACDKSGNEIKTAVIPYDELKLPDMLPSGKISENESYSLEWDSERACIMLSEKNSGRFWSTIPYDYYVTGKKTGRAGIMMGSPLMLSYVSRSNRNAIKTVNAQTAVLKNGSVYSEKTQDGIRVYYCFDKLEIIIPVEYNLRKTGMSISIDPKKICEYDNLVYTISLTPFLCSSQNSGNTSEQYLVLPSGNGALMYTKPDSSGKAREYSEPVYGTDLARHQGEKTINTQTVRMPVFGAKDGNSAICAIIENGATCALVETLAGDEKIGWSAVYPTFTLRGNNVSAIAFQGGNVSDVETISAEMGSKKLLSVGYYPLSGEKANYIGMAEVCRNYLTEQSGKKSDGIKENSLTLQIMGGLQIKQLFLGIPYQKTVSATTFSEAMEIIKSVEKRSKLPTDVVLCGFGESGLDTGKIAGGYGLAKEFGSKKDFTALQDYCKTQNKPLYIDFETVCFNSSGNGFSKTFDTAKSANSFTAYLRPYSTALRVEDDMASRYMLLSRGKLIHATDKLFKYAGKISLSGVGLSSLGEIIYSDYDSSDYAVCNGMDSDVTAIINNAHKKGLSILVSGGNSYAAINAEKVINTPVSSSMYDILDAEIPLYQSIFKGITDNSVAPINTAINARRRFLQAIEGGSGLSFALSARYETDFATTMHSELSTSLAEDNLDMIADMSAESEKYYAAVRGAVITKHDILSDTLRRVEFDNGVTLWVNYGDKEAILPEGSVKPESFMFRRDLQ